MQTARAQLFTTCLIESFYPNTAAAVISTLEAAGVSVSFPEGQTCCGQPAYNAGFWDDAIPMARCTIERLESDRDPIVIPSGSCTHMIRHGYPRLFRDDPAWSRRVSELARRTYEWSEFLVQVRGVEGFKTSYPGRIAYHASCHLTRGLGVSEQPRELLLRSFDPSQVEILPDICCGFGGVFAVEQPELSTAMLDSRLQTILASGVDIISGCDVSCLMQIEGRLRRLNHPVRCAHLSEIFIDTSTEQHR